MKVLGIIARKKKTSFHAYLNISEFHYLNISEFHYFIIINIVLLDMKIHRGFKESLVHTAEYDMH